MICAIISALISAGMYGRSKALAKVYKALADSCDEIINQESACYETVARYTEIQKKNLIKNGV